MRFRLPFASQTSRGIWGASVGLWISATSCGSNEILNPFVDSVSGGSTSMGVGGANPTGGANSSVGGTGGTSSSVACTPEKLGPRQHPVGNYDNKSCNKVDCHVGVVGGWVYASAKGYPWVPGATVTITNQDGSTLTTGSGTDGFFEFGADPKISSPYKVCVSKCPSTDCNLTPHTSTDCLAAGCHALPTLRIYVTSPSQTGTGGAPATGANCASPTSGGPYVHAERTTSARANQPCANCHAEPTYVGGYLYDGPRSTTTIAEATIELTGSNGTVVKTVTGPEGMFFFGTNASTVTLQTIPVPYTACVSKCPTSRLCSITNGHTTNADCGTCHDEMVEDGVYLR